MLTWAFSLLQLAFELTVAAATGVVESVAIENLLGLAPQVLRIRKSWVLMKVLFALRLTYYFLS
ncbi:MAG: hypothetical protein JSU96_02775 [Acidobacteriota bacterium]|nr:MAG: hypothetical protein JSU96_02775 [Acidobacteriota bacterium]